MSSVDETGPVLGGAAQGGKVRGFAWKRDELWGNTSDWHASVDQVVDTVLSRVSILEQEKALSHEPDGAG